MRKQTKRWPGHIAECSSSCAVPRHVVGVGGPSPTCGTRWLRPVRVGSGSETHAPAGRHATWQACCERPQGHQPTCCPRSVLLLVSGLGVALLPTCVMAHVLWTSGGTAPVPCTAWTPRSPEVQKQVLEEGWCCVVT